jgi:hypothetical protein
MHEDRILDAITIGIGELERHKSGAEKNHIFRTLISRKELK